MWQGLDLVFHGGKTRLELARWPFAELDATLEVPPREESQRKKFTF
jgi:hypothetical protein